MEGLSDMLAADLLDTDLVNTLMSDRSQIKTEAEISDNRRNINTDDDCIQNLWHDKYNLFPFSGGLDSSSQLHNSCDDNGHKDELTDFLSAQFNLESLESAGLPSMDSKDVEDIFKGVLVEESQEPNNHLFHVAPQPPLARPRPGPPTPSVGIPQSIIPSPVLSASCKFEVVVGKLNLKSN